MSSGGQEKTESATPKRKREARKRGQIPRSRELGAAAVVGSMAVAAQAFGGKLAAAASQQMQQLLSLTPAMLVDAHAMPAYFGQALMHALLLCVPLFAAAVVAAIAAPLLLGGWNFSIGALKPDFNKLNPIPGIGRMFSGQAAMELFKGLLKLAWIGGVGAQYLWLHRDALIGLSGEPTARAIGDGGAILGGALVWLSMALVAVAAVDAPYQLLSYAKKMKMSRQEVRDEHKQSEGRPEVKGRIRRMQMELSRRRMAQQIPNADVIITNPTHYAVALKYDSTAMRAPRVIAKGADELAAMMRELARAHRIPIVAAPPLARALYRSVKLDQEIPAALYAAVARVLTYVYQLRNWSGTGEPTKPEIETVPGGEPDPR